MFLSTLTLAMAAVGQAEPEKAKPDTPPAVAAISERLRKYIDAKEIAGAVTLVATPDQIARARRRVASPTRSSVAGYSRCERTWSSGPREC